jgi:hypothetical protein
MPADWLLLIHQIPPKPDYLRVKIGRRLQRVGAVPVKNSVYVLPAGDQAVEDFQWVRAEIVDGGGDAVLCRAELVAGLDDDAVRALFRAARGADYAEIAAAATEGARGADDVTRLRRRLAAVRALDFFYAPERADAERAVDALEARARPAAAVAEAAAARRAIPSEYRGRTWVTREGIFVDRIASAWLVARFIDPEARFKFVPAAGYRPRAGELRFDMFDAEFTHVGDRCTFEVLLDRFALDDPALVALGEIVHDIDLKDGKFGREDAAGIERVLAGIARARPDDAARLERGRQLFDELYALHSAEAAERLGRPDAR